jgi:hypothetical protein
VPLCLFDYVTGPHAGTLGADEAYDTRDFVNDGACLWELLRVCDGRRVHPGAMILDSRALQSTPGSGGRASNDGAKCPRARKCIWPWAP